jgi:excisionase family DNA binding protein
MSEPLLLRAPEAAQTLAISQATLWKLVASREVPFIRIGRAVRFPHADLQRWIAERTAATQQPGRLDAAPPSLKAVS